MKRYFLIACRLFSKNHGDIITSMWFAFEGFPSNNWIKEQALKGHPGYHNAVITNIMEFKSEEDYKNFIKDEES